MKILHELEERVGNVSREEIQFALSNMRLEVRYKNAEFNLKVSKEELLNILISNIEFARKYKNLVN